MHRAGARACSLDVLVHARGNESIDFDAFVGQDASFTVRHAAGERTFRGIVSHLQHVGVSGADGGLSTYQLVIVPTLWLATQRKNYRMFQQISEPDIVLEMLRRDWGIDPDVKLTGTYKKRKYRVQYGESDYAFMRRMLEDAGISFLFEDRDGETKLVLTDAPQASEPRAPLLFRDKPAETGVPFVTDVRVAQQVRPGKYTIRDHDYRLAPTYKLAKTAAMHNVPIEEKLERYQYTPGAFLFEAEKGDDTPSADDRGKTRTDEREGEQLVRKRLEAKRSAAKLLTFDTSAHDLAAGVVMSMVDHPRADLAPGKRWLVTASQLSGTPEGRWTHTCEAATADIPFRPPLVTPKPKVIGVESASLPPPPLFSLFSACPIPRSSRDPWQLGLPLHPGTPTPERDEPSRGHASYAGGHTWVLWRKRSFGTDSPRGSRFVERILTVVITLRLQKRNVLDYMTAACQAHLRGEPPPSLLPG